MTPRRCGGCGASDHVEADCPRYSSAAADPDVAELVDEQGRPTSPAPHKPFRIDPVKLAHEVELWEKERDSRK